MEPGLGAVTPSPNSFRAQRRDARTRLAGTSFSMKTHQAERP